ncbi:5-dehydro-2-deoxygluconokinase [Georgenia faecalis]|uniref:5-dehydro-2-deoxygluconokinase n=1 Tax=Georgenia faecalis TaxID=2483799 RepID=UPI0024081741|nr:5-dehydro-2-deoxygluconokinase [Georgenia faecalis]
MTGTRAEAPYDVLTMGRCGVDLYPLQSGVGLEDVETFGKFLGGSATNVAVAAARLGARSAVVTGVGDDPFGRFVRREMRALGVDDRFVHVRPGAPTPVTFCALFPPDDFPLWFYRAPLAPDLQVGAEDLDLDAIAAARLFWVTVTGLSAEPSRTAHHAALDARAGRRPTVLDLDYRPVLWADPDDAPGEVARVLEKVSVVVGNEAECRMAVGESDPDRAADALLERGVELAIVKRGPHGALAKTHGERVEVPSTRVGVVNGLGAGDAFGGALCRGLLDGWDLAETLAFAGVAGAIVASRLACAAAMPTAAEVAEVRAGGVGAGGVAAGGVGAGGVGAAGAVRP